MSEDVNKNAVAGLGSVRLQLVVVKQDRDSILVGGGLFSNKGPVAVSNAFP